MMKKMFRQFLANKNVANRHINNKCVAFYSSWMNTASELELELV